MCPGCGWTYNRPTANCAMMFMWILECVVNAALLQTSLFEAEKPHHSQGCAAAMETF